MGVDLKSYIIDFRVKSALKVALAAVICVFINSIENKVLLQKLYIRIMLIIETDIKI